MFRGVEEKLSAKYLSVDIFRIIEYSKLPSLITQAMTINNDNDLTLSVPLTI